LRLSSSDWRADADCGGELKRPGKRRAHAMTASMTLVRAANASVTFAL
jgi:hypothetical protein